MIAAKNKNKTRAVIYCRVSTKEQAQNLSLPYQEKVCRAYCETNGWEVLEVFSDAESGKTIHRTNFQVMLDFCGMNSKKIAAVVVSEASRFSRETMDALTVDALLGSIGILVRFATQPIDESPTGKLLKTMSWAFATYENNIKALRSIAGMKAAIEQGLWVHRAPLGYLNVTPAHKQAPNLLPDPERAPFVRQAFEAFADGSFRKSDVLDRVTTLGLRDTSGSPVSAQSFDKMLRNPVYTGWITSSFGVRARGRFEPIITEEVFARAQAVLAGRGTKNIERGSLGTEFPLRGFMRCSECGTPLTASFSTGRRGGKYPYYFCREQTCHAVKFRREDLHLKFVMLLESFRPNDGSWPLFVEALNGVWAGKHEVQARCGELLAKRNAELNTFKNSLVRSLVDGRLPQRHFDEQMATVETDLAAIAQELLETLPAEKELAALIDFTKWVLENAGTTWYAAKSEQKVRIQQALFPSGVMVSSQGFRTPESLSLFKQIDAKIDAPEDLASPGGFEPPLPP